MGNVNSNWDYGGWMLDLRRNELWYHVKPYNAEKLKLLGCGLIMYTKLRTVYKLPKFDKKRAKFLSHWMFEVIWWLNYLLVRNWITVSNHFLKFYKRVFPWEFVVERSTWLVTKLYKLKLFWGFTLRHISDAFLLQGRDTTVLIISGVLILCMINMMEMNLKLRWERTSVSIRFLWLNYASDFHLEVVGHNQHVNLLFAVHARRLQALKALTYSPSSNSEILSKLYEIVFGILDKVCPLQNWSPATGNVTKLH